MLTDKEYIDITKAVLDPYFKGWPPPAHLPEMAEATGFTVHQVYEGINRRFNDIPYEKKNTTQQVDSYRCSVCDLKRNRTQFLITMGICMKCRKEQLANGAPKKPSGPRRGPRSRKRYTERNALSGG